MMSFVQYLLLSACLLTFAPTYAEQSRQPNIVILLADDISSSSLGCYGGENPHTSPHIDLLARQSVVFDNMFVTQAVCGPARAELYTGLQPHRNGSMTNHKKSKPGTLSMVHYLRKLGYRVGLTGKTHFGPRSVYPFEMVKGLPRNCNAKEIAGEDWGGTEKFMTRNGKQPFCLVICSVHAHAPWDSGDTSHWKLEDIKLPPHFPDTKESRHYFREYLAEVRLFDDQVGKTRSLLKKHDLDENTILIVLDENGAGMPGGKWTNHDWGVRSACLIKYPKLAAFRTDTLAQYCDIVPTLIEAAGGAVPKNIDGRSLLPVLKQETDSLRDKAFFNYTSGSEGPKFDARAVTDGKYKFMWNLTPGNKFAVRTINGFDYGYIDKKMPDRHVRQLYQSWLRKAKNDAPAQQQIDRFRAPPEYQLYNLSKDSWEQRNLANHPEHKYRIESFKKSIRAWMKQQGDPGVLQK
ncbi:sulfatase [Verrucomicrobiaceae bacterium 5K15]|uniref:Sulfatase n=1 Tax=Oceaniferula flava TaxID=2800421 RepID=A0AAE2S9U2_9BACT|nr:sulfatase [Oceaniferula flavus]MBK1853996.1 sulfatase [Oceaniferula flavus]MBM1135302.1 sulfatase [Oceaniferula flavus]